jgi:hypothetical protein
VAGGAAVNNSVGTAAANRHCVALLWEKRWMPDGVTHAQDTRRAGRLGAHRKRVPQVHATFFFEKITVKNQTTPGRRHPNTTELAGSWSKFCSAASSIFTRKQIIGCACSPKEHGPGPMYPHPPPRRIGANFRGRLRQFHGSTTALRILGREAFVGQHARGDRPPAHRRDSSRPSPPAPALRAIPPPARAGLKLAALAKSLHSLSVFRQGFPILGVQIGS